VKCANGNSHCEQPGKVTALDTKQSGIENSDANQQSAECAEIPPKREVYSGNPTFLGDQVDEYP